MNQPIMKPVITIGFPVYNVERFVERSLKSALEQDFDLPYDESRIGNEYAKNKEMALMAVKYYK